MVEPRTAPETWSNRVKAAFYERTGTLMATDLVLVLAGVERVVATPPDQFLLLLDRLNDLEVALGEYGRLGESSGG